MLSTSLTARVKERKQDMFSNIIYIYILLTNVFMINNQKFL